MKTLLTGGVVVTCDEQHTIFDTGDVVLEDDRIAFVGARYDGDYDARISVNGRLLMPGMVNAHTHSGMTILRSLADDDDLMAFLEQRVWPREVLLRDDDVRAGSRLAAVEMLKSGVTTYVDMYFFEEQLAQAALDAGIRALITPTIIGIPIWEDIRGSWEQQFTSALEFCQKWEGRDGRIHTGLGPHAPYTLSLEALQEIAAGARQSQRPLNIHLVETAQERDNFNGLGLGSTVQAMENIGLFGGPVISAHSVWIDAGDCEIYHRHSVGVAHCPQSNAKLGAGIAPVTALLNAEVNVGLGTDGAATNNNLVLWEEMRLAPLLAKVVGRDPKCLPAEVALWMATRMGGQAIHMPDIGVLAPGFKADLISVRLDSTASVPVFGPSTYISHIVYSMGPELVDRVWVNGREVVKDGEVLTLDESEARQEAQNAATSLSERALV
ncbi:MAG: amidohydrolase [Chloroflexota bacterium]